MGEVVHPRSPLQGFSGDEVRVIPIEMGMLGMSLEDIAKGKHGWVKLPLGPVDINTAGGRKWVKIKVTAMEDTRGFRDIIVGNDQGEVKEHTPVELSFEKQAGGYQRVGELYPLPTMVYTVYDDYAEIPYAATETSYIIGTNAHQADSDVPLFTARQLALYATTECYVRFNGNSRVQHHLQRNTPYSFPLKCTIIYVLQDTTSGILYLHSLGGGSA